MRAVSGRVWAHCRYAEAGAVGHDVLPALGLAPVLVDQDGVGHVGEGKVVKAAGVGGVEEVVTDREPLPHPSSSGGAPSHVRSDFVQVAVRDFQSVEGSVDQGVKVAVPLRQVLHLATGGKQTTPNFRPRQHVHHHHRAVVEACKSEVAPRRHAIDGGVELELMQHPGGRRIGDIDHGQTAGAIRHCDIVGEAGHAFGKAGGIDLRDARGGVALAHVENRKARITTSDHRNVVDCADVEGGIRGGTARDNSGGGEKAVQGIVAAADLGSVLEAIAIRIRIVRIGARDKLERVRQTVVVLIRGVVEDCVFHAWNLESATGPRRGEVDRTERKRLLVKRQHAVDGARPQDDAVNALHVHFSARHDLAGLLFGDGPVKVTATEDVAVHRKVRDDLGGTYGRVDGNVLTEKRGPGRQRGQSREAERPDDAAGGIGNA